MTPERRQVLAPAVLLFGILVAHALLETARDALFLARLGPGHLASAYLTIACVALVAMVALRRLPVARDPRRSLVALLVFAAVGTAILAATVTSDSALVFVLYVWTGLVATLVVPSFWTMIDRSNRIVEAKRRFARISAGGVLGAIVGSALASALGHALPPHSLVVAAALAFATTGAAALTLAPAPIPDEANVRHRARSERVQSRSTVRYLRLLLALGIVSTVTLTFVDLTFKRAFAEAFAAEQLATAFGALYTVLNLVGLMIQLFVTSRLLERIGIAGTLTILPALIMLSAIGFVATGAFAAVLVLKLADGGLRHGLHRVGSEILYVPVPPAERDRWKPMIDALGQRGGQMLAALMWFALTSTVFTSHGAAAGLAVLAIGWLAALYIVKRAYIGQFRTMIAAGEIERDVRVTALDADSTRLLTEALSSPDEIEALAALDLLAQAGKVPAFALYHPHRTVVHRALDVLTGELTPDVMRIISHLADHADPQIRASALIAAARAGAGSGLLRAAIDDASVEVRAVAAVWLADDQELGHIAARHATALAQGSTDEQIALARAVESRPTGHWTQIIDELLASHDARVRRAALHILQRAPELANLQRALELLQDPHVRGDARRVFVASGQRGLAALITALDDPRVPLAVRRHIPRTLSRFRSQPAAAALSARLLREPDGTTEFKILRALGRMRADRPDLPLDTEILHSYVRRSIEDAVRYALLLDRLEEESTPSIGLIRELLAEKQRWAIEHTFRALGIVDPRADVRNTYAALVGPNKELAAAAHELVEPMLPAELRSALFAVLDDLPAEVRRKRLTAAQSTHRPLDTPEQVLLALLTDPSESLKCLAAHHIAERRLGALRSHLDRLRPSVEAPLVMYAFDQAIARLDARD